MKKLIIIAFCALLFAACNNRHNVNAGGDALEEGVTHVKRDAAYTSKPIFDSSEGYHYVLAKPFHQEVAGWQFDYKGKQYPAKVPGFIQDDLKKMACLQRDRRSTG